jgi:hypothetical protein
MPTTTPTPTPTVSILKLKDGKVIDTLLFSNPVKKASIDYHGKRVNITPNGVRITDTGINDNTLYIVFANTRPADVHIGDTDYNYDITIHFPHMTVVMFVNGGTVNVSVATP